MKEKSAKKSSKKEVQDDYSKTGELILTRIKKLLEENKSTVADLSAALGIKSNSFYISLKRGKYTIEMLEKTAEFFKVPVSYFFELTILDRITDEAIKYHRNPDLKSFLLGCNREMQKGHVLESAVGITIDAEAFWKSRL